MTLNWGQALLLTLVLYTLVSLRRIGPTELGARLIFGKPVSNLSSGLVFSPIGICQIKTETCLTIQDEIPGDPTKIFRGDGLVPDGLFPPIRVPFGPPMTEEEIQKLEISRLKQLIIPPVDDPLNVRITAEVVLVIRWKITDYLLFLTTIGSKEESIRQIEDSAVGCVFREAAKITPAVMLANIGTYSQELHIEIQERIDGWGVELQTAQIKMINLHHTLNDAVGDVPEATLKAIARVKSAGAEKEAKRLLGEGDGSAEEAILRGRTKGLVNMKKALDVSSDVIIGAETARAITANPGQKTIVVGSEGFKEIMAVGSALGLGEKRDRRE
ncbi:MAG: SPFH domain-containing protein [Parcubacteria group bacterium]|nr:SPFH domain-containing protein [Parcubacteria group bacterium]MCR4343072.1 SPFH domain-containing protein [Patescibacteria group bacterium]